MTARLRKLITIMLVGVVALGFCFAIPQANGNLSNQLTSLMADTTTYTVTGYAPTATAEVGTLLREDLSTAKAVDNLGVEYPVTAVAVAGGQTLPDGLAFNGMIIEGTPTDVATTTIMLKFDFTDSGNAPQSVESSITFDITAPIPQVTYSLKDATTNAYGSINTDLKVYLSGAKVVDNSESEYAVTAVAVASGQTLPTGLALNGMIISGTTTVKVNQNVTLQYSFIGADGTPQTINSVITFDIDALQGVTLSNIPKGDFVYDGSSKKYLNGIKATVDGVPTKIASFSCLGELPKGLSLDGGIINGKPQELYSAKSIKFAAILADGEKYYFDIQISVSRQHVSNIGLNQYIVTYNGNEQKPTVTVCDQADAALDESNYDIFYYRDGRVTTDLKSAGDIQVKVVCKGNYSGGGNQNYIINKIKVDETYVEDFENVTYDGAEHEKLPVFQGYTETGYIVEYFRGEDEAYEFINAGEITVKITFEDNYEGQLVRKYSILPVAAPASDVVFAADVEFDGKSHSPMPQVDVKWARDVDYKITITKDGVAAKNFVDVGAYLVKVDFINNVSGSFESTFTITPKSINPLLEGTIDYVYNGAARPPTTYPIGDDKLGIEYKLGIDYDLLCYRGTVVTSDFTSSGEIKVVVQMKGNYTGSAETKYFIYPSVLQVASKDKLDMSIASGSGFKLDEKFSVSSLENVSFSLRYGANEKLAYALKINMLKGDTAVDLSSVVTIRFKTNILAKDIKGIRVEYFERGKQTSKAAAIDNDGYIVFDVYSVGEMAIVVDYPVESTIPVYVYFAIGGGVLVLVLIIVLAIFVISKRTGIRTVLPRRRR